MMNSAIKALIRRSARRIRHDLEMHGLNVGVLKSEDDVSSRDYDNLLIYKLEQVEFGFKHIFGRHTNVKVSYTFKTREGKVIRSDELKEHSKQGWKVCVRTISQKITDAVAADTIERLKSTARNEVK